MQIITVKGLDKILGRFKDLEQKDAKKICQSAFRTAMKPVLEGAQLLAPSETGFLASMLKIKSYTKKKKNTFGVRVSIGSKEFVGKAYYGAFQEFGWKSGKRYTGARHKRWVSKFGGRKWGGTRRQIEGAHFVREAYETKGDAAKQEAQRLILKKLDRWAKKQGVSWND